jgi:hypothetical protein
MQRSIRSGEGTRTPEKKAQLQKNLPGGKGNVPVSSPPPLPTPAP